MPSASDVQCLVQVAGVPVEIRMTSDPEAPLLLWAPEHPCADSLSTHVQTPGTTICDQVEEDPAVIADPNSISLAPSLLLSPPLHLPT